TAIVEVETRRVEAENQKNRELARALVLRWIVVAACYVGRVTEESDPVGVVKTVEPLLEKAFKGGFARHVQRLAFRFAELSRTSACGTGTTTRDHALWMPLHTGRNRRGHALLGAWSLAGTSLGSKRPGRQPGSPRIRRAGRACIAPPRRVVGCRDR